MGLKTPAITTDEHTQSSQSRDWEAHGKQVRAMEPAQSFRSR